MDIEKKKRELGLDLMTDSEILTYALGESNLLKKELKDERNIINFEGMNTVILNQELINNLATMDMIFLNKIIESRT